MDDLFKKLFQGEELPPELKKEVKNSLETAKMLMSVADLFTSKFALAETEFLGGLDEDSPTDTKPE